MRKTVLLLTLVITFLFSTCVYAESDIGYVNLEQLLAQSTKLQTIQKNFTAYQNKVISDFEHDKKNLSENDARIMAEAFQEDINMREQMAAARLDANIRAAIQIVANKQNLSLVINNTGTYYGCKDITSDVISVIDAGQN